MVVQSVYGHRMTCYNYEIYFLSRMLVSVLHHGYKKYVQTITSRLLLLF